MNPVSCATLLVFWTKTSRTLAEVKNEDAVYVLAYSIIMLNTDLHNPQIRVSLSEPYLRIPGVQVQDRKK
jgi:hypothetical protein